MSCSRPPGGRRPARSRPAFTLIELVIVLTIVGMLVALVFSAIQNVRATALRTQCAARMREVGLAIQQFEAQQNYYPGWRHYPFSATDAVTGRSITFATGWFPQLLPHLQRSDIFEQWKNPVVSSGAPLGPTPDLHSLAVCPADFRKLKAGSAALSYVVNCGRRDAQATATIPADWRSNGIFLDLVTWSGSPSNRVLVQQSSASYVSSGDGLSTTILLTENYDAGRWYQTRESLVGVIFYPPGVQPRHRINGPTLPGKPSFLNARPASYHQGGANVVFAAGNGCFLNENIDYAVYCALMTPRGATAREPGTLNPSPPSITHPPKIEL